MHYSQHVKLFGISALDVHFHFSSIWREIKRKITGGKNKTKLRTDPKIKQKCLELLPSHHHKTLTGVWCVRCLWLFFFFKLQLKALFTIRYTKLKCCCIAKLLHVLSHSSHFHWPSCFPTFIHLCHMSSATQLGGQRQAHVRGVNWGWDEPEQRVNRGWDEPEQGSSLRRNTEFWALLFLVASGLFRSVAICHSRYKQTVETSKKKGSTATRFTIPPIFWRTSTSISSL